MTILLRVDLLGLFLWTSVFENYITFLCLANFNIVPVRKHRRKNFISSICLIPFLLFVEEKIQFCLRIFHISRSFFVDLFS